MMVWMQARYHSRFMTSTGRLPLPQSKAQPELVQQLHSIMGQVMPLLAIFMESIPEQFIASQSISMLDGTTRMSTAAFDNVKVSPGLLINTIKFT